MNAITDALDDDDPNRPETEEDGIRAEAIRRARVRHMAGRNPLEVTPELQKVLDKQHELALRQMAMHKARLAAMDATKYPNNAEDVKD